MARTGNGSSDYIDSTPRVIITDLTVAFWYRNGVAAETGGATQPWSWASVSDGGFQFSWDHPSGSYYQAWSIYDGGWNAI